MKDDSLDPVDSELKHVDPCTGRCYYRYWAYKPTSDGKTRGLYCGYCFKVYIGRHSVFGATLISEQHLRSHIRLSFYDDEVRHD